MEDTTVTKETKRAKDARVARNQLKYFPDLEVSVPPKSTLDLHANIQDLSITTDSVVATATVATNGTSRRVLVDWGDGETDIVNTIPGVHVPLGTAEPLPEGTYRLSHAYAEPDDRLPFEFFVLVRVEDFQGSVDFRVRKITLTPRYRCTNYRTSVRLASQCDSIFESSNEFDITQIVDDQPVNQWHWEPSNNFFGESQFFRLEGSGVTRELTVADGLFNIRLEFVERDPVFDDHLATSQSFGARTETELVEREITTGGGGCKVIVRYDREIQLIVPLPRTGPTLEVATA